MSIILTAGYLEILQLTKFALKAENQTKFWNKAGCIGGKLKWVFIHYS